MKRWTNWCAATHGHGMMEHTEGSYYLASDVDALLCLAADEVVYFYRNEAGNVEPFILCSDTFGYACADLEQLPLDQIHVIADLHKRFGYDGVVAWCAKKRGCDPIKERLTEKYREARSGL